MSKAKENAKQIVSAGGYATAADFKQIFTEDINSLYFLSLLLTGNHEKAEECFVEGIGESANGNHVFREWARSWARRTIVQCAIRIIAPRERTESEIRTADVARLANEVPMELHAEVCAILALAPLNASFSSCRFSSDILISIVPFSWVSREGILPQCEFVQCSS